MISFQTCLLVSAMASFANAQLHLDLANGQYTNGPAVQEENRTVEHAYEGHDHHSHLDAPILHHEYDA